MEVAEFTLFRKLRWLCEKLLELPEIVESKELEDLVWNIKLTAEGAHEEMLNEPIPIDVLRMPEEK